MYRSFLLFITLLFVLAISSCGKKGLTLKIGDQDILALGSIDSCNFVQNSQGIRVSWKSSTPVHFIISPSVPEKYDTTLIKAVGIWNTYLDTELIKIHRDNTITNAAGDDKYNMIYWSTEWPADQSTEQGRTAIRWDVSKLQDADIKINAKYFTYFSENESPTVGKVSLLSLVIHEIGHGLGLKHIDDIESVMQSHLASGTNRNKPGKLDTESLKCEY